MEKQIVGNNFPQHGQMLLAAAQFLSKPLFVTAIQDSLLQKITKELFNKIKNKIKKNSFVYPSFVGGSI